MTEQTEQRLEREARTVFMGPLGDPATCTDSARVEISWSDANERERAGYFTVYVVARGDSLENHPATLASDRASAELERRAQEYGWTYWSIDDVYAA